MAMARVIVGTRYLSPVWAAEVAKGSGEKAARARRSMEYSKPIQFGIEICPRPVPSSPSPLGEDAVHHLLPEGVMRFRLPSLTKANCERFPQGCGVAGALRMYASLYREGWIDDSPAFALAGSMPIVVGAGAILDALCHREDGICDKLIAVPSLEIENTSGVLQAGPFVHVSNSVGKIVQLNELRGWSGMSPATLCWNPGNVHQASGVEQVFTDLACFKEIPIVTNSVRLEVGPLPFLHARHAGKWMEVCNLLAQLLEINPDLDIIFEVCGCHTFGTHVKWAWEWADYLGVIIADVESRRREDLEIRGILGGRSSHYPPSVSD